MHNQGTQHCRNNGTYPGNMPWQSCQGIWSNLKEKTADSCKNKSNTFWMLSKTTPIDLLDVLSKSSDKKLKVSLPIFWSSLWCKARIYTSIKKRLQMTNKGDLPHENKMAAGRTSSFPRFWKPPQWCLNNKRFSPRILKAKYTYGRLWQNILCIHAKNQNIVSLIFSRMLKPPS